MFSVSKCKKHVTFWCIALILLMIFSALVSCEQDLDDMDYPDEKRLEDIEKQYQAEVNDEMHIAHCFGVYNGCVLIMFEGGFWPSMGTTLEIEDFKFYFPTPNVMQVWRAGDFLPLDEAYNEGWLTHENIADIHKQYQDYQKSK